MTPRAVGWVGGLQILMSIVHVASVASVRSRSKCEEVAAERRFDFAICSLLSEEVGERQMQSLIAKCGNE